jgi:hypothetical protein
LETLAKKMKLLQRLFGSRPNPTEDWPIVHNSLPDFDITRMQLGSLTFGDTIQKAKSIGRPDAVEWLDKDYLQLVYRSLGLLLEFESQRLCYIGLIVASGDFDHKLSDMKCAFPRIAFEDGRNVVLSHENHVEQIKSIFGEPTSIDSDDVEVILLYKQGVINMEFEFSPQGKSLRRWNIYLEK